MKIESFSISMNEIDHIPVIERLKFSNNLSIATFYKLLIEFLIIISFLEEQKK